MNAGISQGSRLIPTILLLCVNDLPKSIPQSLVNIYTDDTMPPKISMTLSSRAANLSSDQSFNKTLGENTGSSYSVAQKTKLVTLHHQ